MTESAEQAGPDAADSVATFVEQFRSLKVQAGNPSLNDLARRAGVPRSTVADAFSPQRHRLPRLELVTALVRAFGCPPAEVDRWESAWKRVERTLLGLPPTPARGHSFLPPDVPDFTGRSEEAARLVAEIETRAASTVVISAIDGMAGVGKTTLAVHLGHRLRARFPDGQFFLDLQAHTAGMAPVEPASALHMLLRAWGMATEDIPDTLAERAAAWRSEVADRRVLLVLDNAASADQVCPLLPGTPGSLVLVTSRAGMPGLVGARSLSLDVLPSAEAVDLFAQVLGERADAEPDAVAEAVRLCGGLPLAIRVAAARLHHRSAWTVRDLVRRLAEGRRLTELSTVDGGVATAFAVSYRQLNAEQRRMFRLLGVFPGPSIDALAAAALADLPVDRAEALLEELLDVHLVRQDKVGRYTLHDLLRDYARATAQDKEPADHREAAIHRLLDYYLRVTDRVGDLLAPDRPHVELPLEPWSLAVPVLDDQAAALAWADAERPNLVAALRRAGDLGLDHYLRHIPRNLTKYLMFQCTLDENVAVHQTVIESARRTGDWVTELRSSGNLSVPYRQAGEYRLALTYAERAVALARMFDPRSLGPNLNNLGTVLAVLGDYPLAIAHFQESLAAYAAAGLDTHRSGSAARNLGAVLNIVGRHDEARELLWRAVEMARAAGDEWSEAFALNEFGTAIARLGRRDEAITHLRTALAIGARTGDPRSVAQVRGNLAEVLRQAGRHDEAVTHVRRAMADLRTLRDVSQLADLHHVLGLILHDLGRFQGALAEHRRALHLADPIGDLLEQSHAHRGMALAFDALGEVRSATEHWRLAHEGYAQLGVPLAVEAARRLTAEGERV
ncbi:ATP-binding protein [Solihabitans fulvus]|nr:tetratricopeptide repeat protein [Solihabitans fulvus]